MKIIRNEAVALLRSRFDMSKDPLAEATDVERINEQAEADEYLIGVTHGIEKGLRLAIEILETVGFKEVEPVIEAAVAGMVGKYRRKNEKA